ncbi:MAG: group II truncated hemoglobin [Pseudomonadota bacterium]
MQTHYERLGGEEKLRQLVDHFYDLMESEPESYGIRKLHPQDLSGSRQKLFMFLSGWLGGPPLYVDAYGHPMLRARHLPFTIGNAERDQWMRCMVRALRDVGIEERLAKELEQAFAKTADHMRNQPL